MLKLEARGAGLVFDQSIGNLPDLWFGGIHPLHKAPWYGEVEDLQGLPAVERRLAGDFLCMPFGKSDVVADPQHGYTSNGEWALLDRISSDGRHSMRLELQVPVMGARVQKELRLIDGHSVLYQRHEITGGEGQTTLAHHPMIEMADGGRLSFSPKRVALTPDKPLVEGRSILAYPARSAKFSAFPGDKKSVNLHRYPETSGHDDFITLVEAEGSKIGWTAVVRKAEGDVIFILKESAILPVTMLWYSNGGRSYAPWSGRHIGVLGIEDGIAAGAAGHKAALGDNAVKAEGVKTCLTLGAKKKHVIRHAIGAVPAPAGFDEVSGLELIEDRVLISSPDGTEIVVDFDPDFFRSAVPLPAGG
jgi:hypothetical protein